MSAACAAAAAEPAPPGGAGDAAVRRALALRTFAPITLPALTGCAALTTRVERKYLLTTKDVGSVCAMLPPEAQILEIAGLRRFRYASVYFDTPGWDVYLATAHHREHRFKVRTRAYLDSGELFVEVKRRLGRFTIKERARCDVAELLTPAAAAHVSGYLAEACSFDIDVAALGPALRTAYRRTTLYLPESGSRVNFDTALSFSTSVGARIGRTVEFPELVILETKTAGPPSSLDRLLWSLGTRPVKFSKFGTGLAWIHPELPHTRWARLMRNGLAAGAVPAPARA